MLYHNVCERVWSHYLRVVIAWTNGMGCATAYCIVLNAVTDLTYPNPTAHNNGKILPTQRSLTCDLWRSAIPAPLDSSHEDDQAFTDNHNYRFLCRPLNVRSGIQLRGKAKWIFGNKPIVYDQKCFYGVVLYKVGEILAYESYHILWKSL